jgi:hypothetical protein
VQQTIIDPEGDFVLLSDRFGHLLIDADAVLFQTPPKEQGDENQHQAAGALQSPLSPPVIERHSIVRRSQL